MWVEDSESRRVKKRETTDCWLEYSLWVYNIVLYRFSILEKIIYYDKCIMSFMEDYKYILYVYVFVYCLMLKL